MAPWIDKLPPLKKYMHHLFEEKKTKFVHSPAECYTKAVAMKMVQQELFHPKDDDNRGCTYMMEQLAKTIAQTWKRELMDSKKATYQHLSDSGSPYCWANCTPEMKEAFWGKRAVNNLAESSFAGVTAQLQKFGRINIANAAGVSDMQRNKFLKRATTSKKSRNNQQAYCM